MKTNLKGRIIRAGCLLMAGASAMATPFQRADLPADAAWVVHVDCDLLRTGTVGQYLQEELRRPEVQAKLAAFQALFSFDLQKQLHALTLYSASIDPKDGVLVIYGDFDAEHLLTLVKGADGYQGITHNQRVIHSWNDKNKKGHPRIYAALQGGRLIFGQRQGTVGTALDVLDGAVPSLATDKAFPQLGGSAGGSSIQGATRRLDFPSSDPNALLFRLSKQIRIEIGEVQGQVTAKLTLQVEDEAVAGQMAAVGQGLVALGRLANKPELTKLVEAVSVKQAGVSVVATLSLPAAEVMNILKADAERKAARKAQ